MKKNIFYEMQIGGGSISLTLIPSDKVKVGMRAEASQLKGIYDKYMILLYENPDDTEGTLVFYGDSQNEEYAKWFEQDKPITPIYNSKNEMKDVMVYDE